MLASLYSDAIKDRFNFYNCIQFLLKHCISLEVDDENLNTLAAEKYGDWSHL